MICWITISLRLCWLSILAQIIPGKDHSNLIKRFSYRALKGMWSMLWRIEAAGRNQEDVVLFSCQIINSGQTRRGWSSWTARHIICQSLLCTSETPLKLLHCTCKCSLTAAVEIFFPPPYSANHPQLLWMSSHHYTASEELSGPDGREMWSTLSLNKRLLLKIQRS